MTIAPAKFLSTTIVSITDHDWWIDEINNPPWNYYPYKWLVECTVEIQAHGVPNISVIPNFYSGLDMKAGDWFSDSLGKTYRISETVMLDANNVTLVIEDVDQYNTNNDPLNSGYGQPASLEGFVYSLDLNGIPNFQNVPIFKYPADIFPAISSRFTSKNEVEDYVTVYQTNNGFDMGDFIKVDEENEGRYEQCSANEINVAVGIVNGVNSPRPDYFTFKPLLPIANDVNPPLDGAYGDIFYLDPMNPGKVTSIKPVINPRPVYIRLESGNRAIRLNAISDTNTESHVLKISGHVDNQVEFQMPSTAADVTLMSINGIENTNFTFDAVTKMVTFDPVATGYIVEASDEVIFTYVT